MRKLHSKTLALLVAVVFAASMFALGAPAAGANGCPMSDVVDYPLYADQDMQVGWVHVSNCLEHVHVSYEITEAGWGIVETHTQIVTDPMLFPMTKTGNPIPGQFEDSMYWDMPGVMTYEFIKSLDDLGAGYDDVVYVAAHAKVARTITGSFTPEVTWERSSEQVVTSYPGWGASWTKEQAFAIPLDPFQVVWDSGTYHAYPGPGVAPEFASWLHINTGATDLRRLQASFDVPEEYTITGAHMYTGDTAGIPINDNLYVFVNEGDLQYWGGTRVYTGQVPAEFMGVIGVAAIWNKPGPPYETDGWYIPGEMPELTGFIAGANVIDIFVEENASWGGIGKPTIEFDWEMIECESAWAATEVGEIQFPGANWATYVDYTIDRVLVDELDVPSDGTAENSIALVDGMDFVLEASGTYKFVTWATAEYPQLGYADAQYSYRLPGVYAPNTQIAWVDGESLTDGYAHYLELWVDGAPAGWAGSYTDHIYTLSHVGNGSALSFSIKDNAYGDNEDSLHVKIYALP